MSLFYGMACAQRSSSDMFHACTSHASRNIHARNRYVHDNTTYDTRDAETKDAPVVSRNSPFFKKKGGGESIGSIASN